MAPKKAKTVRRDQKHGKNGKKEGLSGSSFFTWFMVIALLGVWTSVAVVWFDLVDYEEFLGKLGDYDADGDGDFDVDDAKVLLGLTKDGSSVNIDSLEEVLNILAEESSDWFYGFLSFLYDVMTPFEMVEEDENDPADDDDDDDDDGLAQPPVTERATKAPDLKGGLKTKTKEEGLKERSVSAKVSEDLDVTDSLPSDISDDDLEDVIKDSQSLDDGFDLEHALDDHEIQDDVEIDFSLEDAVEPSVHGSLRSEPEVEETEGEPVTEEEVHVEEPTVEELTIDSIIEDILEQELAASHGDNVEEATYEDEHVAYHEQEAEQTDDTEFLNAPTPEIEEPVDVEDGPEPVADEEPEEEQATEDEDPLDENVEEPEKAEYHEESVLMGREDVNEPAEDESDEVNEYNDQTEQEEEEPAELSDEPYGESVPEQTEGAAPEASDVMADVIDTNAASKREHEKTGDVAVDEDTEDAVRDDSEEEINDIPVGEEPSESAEDHNEEPESPHEHVEVEQHEMPEHPVVDGRPADRVEEQVRHSSEGQHGEHAEESSSMQEKQEKAKKKKPKLLNKFDKTIKAELDAAEKLRKKGKVEDALNAFELLVTKYPQSPRARYGKAQSEDDLAEKQRSNDILLRAINSYEEVAGLPNVPTDLVKMALRRKANRQQFLGRMRGSILTLQKLVQLYPEDVSVRNELGVGYLLLGDNQKAKQVYEEVLSLDPSNGFAKVHYGFILKAENKIAESIPYLKEGLLSGESGTDDGRFYFHLGDALQRVGDKEAYTWYEVGHKRGHFASVWQRSLYNVDGLKAQAWWTAKETGYADLVRTLETNWKVIREEGLAVMDASKGLFLPEDENLREKGDWSQYTLWQQGRKNDKSCKAAPRTCALLERFPESIGCRRGQIKYSVMHPGTHVWPHTGPTNCRLRMHLGLVIPNEGCRIRCANDTRSWKEGKVLIFDDSFEHEVWQEADSYRLIFIVDVWHPELTQHQRRTLPAI